jgi:multiple sugar transport system ATP-binding protein
VLYDDPTNLFVAGFIGSPAMNFLPARLDGETLKLPFGDAPIPAKLRGRLQGDGNARDVIAGIRPEHFEDAAVAGDLPNLLKFKTKVQVVESMGSELYAYFDVEAHAESDQLTELAADAGMEDLPSHGDHQQVVARLDAASRASAGQEAEIVLETDEIKLFDPNGGRSLAAAA